MRKITDTQRATLGSVLTGIVWQGVMLVSGVLIARILGVEGRGNFALLALFPIVLAQIGSLGLPMAATYYIARDPSNARAIVRSITAPALLQTVILVAIHGSVLAVLIQGASSAFRIASVFTLAMVPVMLAQQYGIAILQGQRHFARFNALRVLPATFYSTAMVVLFLTSGGRLSSITFFWVAALATAAGITLAIAIRGLPKGHSDAGAKVGRAEMIQFGIKGFIGSISPIEAFRLDQAVVGLLLSPAALGLYVVGMAFTNLPRFIASSIGMVAYPHVADQAGGIATRRSTWRFFWFTVAACMPVVLLLEAAVGWLVPLFFGGEFAGAVALARILLVAAMLLSVRRVLSDCVRGAGFPGYGTVAEVASAITLVFALVLFAPGYGVEGVAFAMVCSAGVGLAVLVSLAVIRVPSRTTDTFAIREEAAIVRTR